MQPFPFDQNRLEFLISKAELKLWIEAKIAKLVDKYLAVITLDSNLKLAKFIDITDDL